MREYDEKCGSKSQPQHQQTNRHPDDKPVKNLTRLKFQNRVYSIRGRKNLRVSLAGRKTNRSSHMQEFNEKFGSKSRLQHQQTSRHPDNKHVLTVFELDLYTFGMPI